jgi:hypothetical protein
VIFEDEAGFSLHPKLGRLWCKRGTANQPVVFTRSQHQQRLNVFGWVDPVHGRHGMIRRKREITDGFLMVLPHIVRSWKHLAIEFWVDRACWHRGTRVIVSLQKIGNSS